MITKQQFLNIDKNTTVNITYGSAFKPNTKVELKPISKPRYSAKYKLYKLTLKNVENLGGVKYYAYLRDGNEKAGFAVGNMAITVNEIKID